MISDNSYWFFLRRLHSAPSGAIRHDATAKRREQRRRWRQLWCLLLLLLLLFFGLALQRGFQAVAVGSVIFSGHSGALDGRVGASEVALRELISDRLGSSFWQLDLSDLRYDLERHPWVNRATIRRQWPNKLWIGIDEHVAIARWNSDYLLSATGILFSVDTLDSFQNLPLFRTVQMASEENIRTHAKLYNQLQRPLIEHQLAILMLEKNRNGDIQITLNNGLAINLGRMDIAQRLTRFLSLLDRVLASKINYAEHIDLRYPDGFSVRWRMPEGSSRLAAVQGAELYSRWVDRESWE